MICWLDGSLIDGAQKALALDDRGFLLGDGLYETIRIAQGRVQQAGRHLARLAHGASVIGLPMPTADIAAAMAAVIAANALQAGSLRLTLTRGSGPRGLLPPQAPSPTLLIAAFPAAPPAAPARVIMATRTRRNEHSPLAGIKSLNCLDGIIARLEARDLNADDALLPNTAGRIAEATAANVFALIGGEWLTPPVTEGALPGITRARILEAGGREAPLTLHDLMPADEIALTSSLGIRPVRELAGKNLPAPGPETAKLIAALFA
ncbi:MAG: aminotransferase class IV [Pseudochelatococcus sp.]|jgi:branched-chain amino acid aminotransferase|uniref:aminotransferase class IV n=1 Tax=Pseudochelatococcus sp. TaxID=2020869 RepID=UPI003D9084E1